MGYLYYGNYAMLYEIGRSEAIRDLGTTYRHMEEDLGIMMPVVQVEARFLLPLKYDELASIETTLTEVPSKMVTFYHKIFNSANELVHTATVKLFFIDMESGRRVSCPEVLTSKIKTYFD